MHLTQVYPLFHLFAKKFHSRWKYDKVMTNIILHSFFETRCIQPSDVKQQLELFGDCDRRSGAYYCLHRPDYAAFYQPRSEGVLSSVVFVCLLTPRLA